MNNYSKEMLEKLSIYELRTKARQLGVKAPTTKRYNQLIDEILKIQSGEMAAFSSNMGRPPKSKTNESSFGDLFEKGLNAGFGYSSIFDPLMGYVFRSNENIDGLNFKKFNFCGVVREVGGVKFLKNYVQGQPYVSLNSFQSQEFKQGSLLCGMAKSTSSSEFGEIIEAQEKEIPTTQENATTKGMATVVTLESVTEMYNFINSNNSNFSIVVEAEANFNLKQEIKCSLFLHTNECDDIVLTHDMLLDAKNLIHYLCLQNKSFNVYFVDIEYIYAILNMYFVSKNEAGDVNAGQYFKEIFCDILNSRGASVVAFEKEFGKRSSYLDIILNKFCQK